MLLNISRSSDDGTCRIWDARQSNCRPRVYLPRPITAVSGRKSSCFFVLLPQFYLLDSELLQERAAVFIRLMCRHPVVLLIAIKSYVVPTMLMELSSSLGALTLMQGYKDNCLFVCFFFCCCCCCCRRLFVSPSSCRWCFGQKKDQSASLSIIGNLDKDLVKELY